MIVQYIVNEFRFNFFLYTRNKVIKFQAFYRKLNEIILKIRYTGLPLILYVFLLYLRVQTIS